MKLRILILVSFLCVGQNSIANCIPAKEIVPYTEEYGAGAYQRVHPDGDFVMYSAGQIKLVDIRTRGEDGKIQPKYTSTPMNDEAYPVEGSWTLIDYPNHMTADRSSYQMNYYRLDEVVKGESASSLPVFSGPEHNQYYHSSA